MREAERKGVRSIRDSCWGCRRETRQQNVEISEQKQKQKDASRAKEANWVTCRVGTSALRTVEGRRKGKEKRERGKAERGSRGGRNADHPHTRGAGQY